MERKNPIAVTIVDRNYPPNKSVIAESASDLAKTFLNHNIEVSIVHTDGSYQGGGAEGDIHGRIHKVRSIYNGKNKFIRLFSSLIEGLLLINKSIKVSTGPIIVMCSPPLLIYWAARKLNKRNIPWIYWSMDLYPEAFVANRLTKEKNKIYQHFFKKIYQSAPSGLISLGAIQAKYLAQKYKKEIPTIIMPCGVLINKPLKVPENNTKPKWKTDDSKIYFGYIGNLGEAHSTDFLKNIIDNINPEKHQLILVVYGSKAQVVKDYIKNPPEGVILLDYVPRNDLNYIDVHLVSLKYSWINVCVPSKLVSAVHQKSLFLFYGDKNCDSWQDFKDAGWIIEPNENAESQTIEFLKYINKEEIEKKKNKILGFPENIESEIRQAHLNIVSMVKKLNE